MSQSTALEALAQFEKDSTYLRAFCQGRRYFHALRALGFIQKTTFGKLRKDGKMPEAHHMVRLALNAIQLQLSPEVRTQGITDEEHLITALLYHDCLEDDTTLTLDEGSIAKLSTPAIAASVWRMTKKFRGMKKSQEMYVKELQDDPIACLGKGLDRCDNLEHMLGVFAMDKVESYTLDAKTVFLPMLKDASKLYPEHLASYQIVRYRMKRDIQFLGHYLDLWKTNTSASATSTSV